MTRMKKKINEQVTTVGMKIKWLRKTKNKNNKTWAIIRKYDRKWMMKKEKRNN
jgi:hypothetical protein